MAGGACRRVVRVNLDGQRRAGEQIFDQQRCIRLTALEPDLADRRGFGRGIGESGPQYVPPPRLFHGMGGEARGRHRRSTPCCSIRAGRLRHVP